MVLFFVASPTARRFAAERSQKDDPIFVARLSDERSTALGILSDGNGTRVRAVLGQSGCGEYT